MFLKNHNPDAFLFVNTGHSRRCAQLKPANINKAIRLACRNLGIDKPITCYSLKRNGVTLRRLRGESDMEIQHAARWTSSKQLKTYDLSTQDEAFRRELEKRGLVPSTDTTSAVPATCAFCGQRAGVGDSSCERCRRQLDRSLLVEDAKNKNNEVDALRRQVSELTARIQAVKDEVLPAMMRDILAQQQQATPVAAASTVVGRSERVRRLRPPLDE